MRLGLLVYVFPNLHWVLVIVDVQEVLLKQVYFIKKKLSGAHIIWGTYIDVCI